MNDVGLMGGMFDPVHNGHLEIARTALSSLELSDLFLLPCGNPVHRKGKFANNEHRIAMLELATGEDACLQVDPRECLSEAPSYTYNTLEQYTNDMPGKRLFYILGQDAFNDFHTWYKWEGILELAHIVIAARPGYQQSLDPKLQGEYESRLVSDINGMKKYTRGKILEVQLAMNDISSSDVREKLLSGGSVNPLLPENVMLYIKANNLYFREEKFGR